MTYPDSIDTFRTVANKPGNLYDELKTTRIFAEDLNVLGTAIENIEETLGTNPEGTKTDVKTRLDDIDDIVPTAPFLKADNELYSHAKGVIIAQILTLCTDLRAFLTFENRGEDYNITDQSLNYKDFTANAESQTLTPGIAGLCPYLTISGGKYFEHSDDDIYSFGDGTTDSPFSICLLMKPSDVTTSEPLSKYKSTTGAAQREYRILFEADSKLSILLYDQSVSKYISKKTDNAYSTDTSQWHTYIFTYNGSSSSAGIKIYRDGDLQAATATDTGGYVAMENGTAKIGNYEIGTGGTMANLGAGEYGSIIIDGNEFTAQQCKLIDKLLRGYVGIIS